MNNLFRFNDTDFVKVCTYKNNSGMQRVQYAKLGVVRFYTQTGMQIIPPRTLSATM
jgi:hypothetical protein